MSAAVDRYARHRAIAGFSQDVLQASRFAVIGAGAIGNEVVKNLCLLGVGAVDVYDFDVVERHNLTRSVLLREADVGTPKAAAVARHAADLDPAVTVTAIAGDIRDTLGIAAARGYHCVIGALDNFEARLRVNQVCWLAGVDWVNAAIDSRSVSVETFPFAAPDRGTLPGRDAAALPACYECGLPASVYGRIAERYSCGGLLRAALRERVMPTTAITASIAGAQAVDAALKLARAPVHGEPMRGEPVHGEPVHSEQVHSEPVHGEPAARRWWFDTGSGHASGARIARNPACPGCGDLPRRARLVRAADARVATIAAAASAAGATTV
ncbi:MAG: ThiF family adenylyltransferase, partial [Lautropia sp.]